MNYSVAVCDDRVVGYGKSGEEAMRRGFESLSAYGTTSSSYASASRMSVLPATKKLYGVMKKGTYAIYVSRHLQQVNDVWDIIE